MKNIFLILPLLLNPISQSDKFFDISIIQDENNNLITTITYNNTERTNAYNNYELDQQGNIITGTQKFGTRSDLNEYINIQTNDYTNIYFNSAVPDNPPYPDYVTYQSNDFFIMAITPYRTISTTRADLTLKANVNFMPTQTPTVVFASVFDRIRIYQTNDNLSTLIDTSNWTTMTAVDDYMTQALELATQKQLLYNTTGEDAESQIYEGIEHEINITGISLNQNITTYIFGTINYRTNYRIDRSIYTPIVPPDDQTQYIHIQEAQLTSRLGYTPPIEVVDIPGLMFTILGMPFSFISQAFNLTLFEGTPYVVNISDIFLGFIAVALLLWVLKLILGRADLGQWIADNKNSYRRQDNRRTKQEAKAYREEHKK